MPKEKSFVPKATRKKIVQTGVETTGGEHGKSWGKKATLKYQRGSKLELRRGCVFVLVLYCKFGNMFSVG